MPVSLKHVQNRTKQEGEEIRALILHLNISIPSEQSERSKQALRRVVPDAGTLARVVLRLQRLVSDPPCVGSVEDQLTDPASRHVFLLNQQLAEYRVFPYIHTSKSGKWAFAWEVQAQAFGDSERPILVSRAEHELPLVLTAIDLAKRGLIDRVKRCPVDRRWFFARVRKGRFCSAKCRTQFHERDPDRKAKRREYMRELYQTHKTKNVK